MAEAPERLPETSAQKQEMDRRLAEYEGSRGESVSWEEVRDSLDETN